MNLLLEEEVQNDIVLLLLVSSSRLDILCLYLITNSITGVNLDILLLLLLLLLYKEVIELCSCFIKGLVINIILSGNKVVNEDDRDGDAIIDNTNDKVPLNDILLNTSSF